jgi:hypothetical protein
VILRGQATLNKNDHVKIALVKKLNRRDWIAKAAAGLLVGSLAPCGHLQAGLLELRPREAGQKGKLLHAVAKGRAFLISVFDPALDLMPEYRGSTVYWLSHDNYLAAKVLKAANPEMAARIERAIRSYGVAQSGKIEILFDEAAKPLPFRRFELLNVKRIGNKTVKTERAGDEPLSGWQDYADLLFFAVMALAEIRPKEARRHFEQAIALWDGQGFNDRVAQKSNQYATYKLALALLAARRLKTTPSVEKAILKRLLALQNAEGGWITDYNKKYRPLGQANVETTSLAILALSR